MSHLGFGLFTYAHFWDRDKREQVSNGVSSVTVEGNRNRIQGLFLNIYPTVTLTAARRKRGFDCPKHLTSEVYCMPWTNQEAKKSERFHFLNLSGLSGIYQENPSPQPPFLIFY